MVARCWHGPASLVRGEGGSRGAASAATVVVPNKTGRRPMAPAAKGAKRDPEPRSGSRLAPFAAGAIGRRPVLFGTTTVAALAAPRLPPSPRTREAGPCQHRATIARGAVLLTLATTLPRATRSFTFFTYIGVIVHR